MPKSMVIVESPAKARTIEKYLGGDYIVRASAGHIKDLPKGGLGVDVRRDFRPTYSINRRQAKDRCRTEEGGEEVQSHLPGGRSRPGGRGHLPASG